MVHAVWDGASYIYDAFPMCQFGDVLGGSEILPPNFNGLLSYFVYSVDPYISIGFSYVGVVSYVNKLG